MKTQYFILAIAFGFAFTSCSEDSLTDTVRPNDYTNSAFTVSGFDADANATITFDFNERVFLTTTIAKAEDTRNMVRITKPQTWNIAGFGDSEIENSGSWDVKLDLDYNIASDAINGTIKFTFPDYGDGFTLVAYGGPVLQRVNGEDDNLRMDLAITRGTGRFEKTKFEGGAAIVLTQAWKDYGEMDTKLQLNGIFTDISGE